MRRAIRELLARPRLDGPRNLAVRVPDGQRILDFATARLIFGFLPANATLPTISKRRSLNIWKSVREYIPGQSAQRIDGRKERKGGPKLPPGRPKRIFPRDEAVKLRRSGSSWREMAKLLGVPATTIRSAIKQELTR